MKNIYFIGIIGLLVGIVIGLFIGGGTQLGGFTEGYWDSAGGYYVDGTTIIDGSGNITGAGTGAFSSTLTVTGETNLDSLIEGGDVTSLSIAATATVSITAAQMCDSTILEWYVSSDNDTGSTTFPTATSVIADCLTTNGDAKTLLFRNTAAATYTTMIAGFGMIMTEDNGNDVAIAGTNAALIHMFRASSTGIILNITKLIDAD